MLESAANPNKIFTLKKILLLIRIIFKEFLCSFGKPLLNEVFVKFEPVQQGDGSA